MVNRAPARQPESSQRGRRAVLNAASSVSPATIWRLGCTLEVKTLCSWRRIAGHLLGIPQMETQTRLDPRRPPFKRGDYRLSKINADVMFPSISAEHTRRP